MQPPSYAHSSESSPLPWMTVTATCWVTIRNTEEPTHPEALVHSPQETLFNQDAHVRLQFLSSERQKRPPAPSLYRWENWGPKEKKVPFTKHLWYTGHHFRGFQVITFHSRTEGTYDLSKGIWRLSSLARLTQDCSVFHANSLQNFLPTFYGAFMCWVELFYMC